MQKKYLNAVLIVFLIIIWSAVFYKYFKPNPNINNPYLSNNSLDSQSDYLVSKDTFDLVFINKNPFKAIERKRFKLATDYKPKPSPKSKKKVFSWPKIKYYGFVKRSGITTRMVLLRVNNVLHKKREGQKINDLLLYKAYNDSVIVSLNGQKKTFLVQ